MTTFSFQVARVEDLGSDRLLYGVPGALRSQSFQVHGLRPTVQEEPSLSRVVREVALVRRIAGGSVIPFRQSSLPGRSGTAQPGMISR